MNMTIVRNAVVQVLEGLQVGLAWGQALGGERAWVCAVERLAARALAVLGGGQS